MTEPEYNHPGVYVDETGGGRPIEGVLTAALTSADERRWKIGIAIGAIALTGVGVWLAAVRWNAIDSLLRTSPGVASVIAIFAAAFVLSALRTIIERRRRFAGRPLLKRGKLAFGVVAFQLSTLLALGACFVIGVVSLVVAGQFASHLVNAGLNLMVGCVFVWMVGGILRDLLLLIQAARDRSSQSSPGLDPGSTLSP